MALTDEDKKRLSKQDQERITAATAKWEAANAAGDEAGKKAAADEAKRIREQAGYYTDSYGRYQGNFNQSSKNEQIVVTSEQAAMDKAFNGGFWGTDVNGFTPISLISPARPTIKNNQQNTAYQGKSSNEDLYGAKNTVKNTAAAPNNANQHPWQTDDEHYAFMEGLMGEDYVKAYKANTKNTAQNKQENPVNAANNKHNSAAGD
ncbi:MAG: hypothetical protein IJP33_00735, partial [Firmicutes bacterium]|nr:hypothetical protein [Bacillota bacterium]